MTTLFSNNWHYQIPQPNQSFEDYITFFNTPILIPFLFLLPALCIWRARLHYPKRLSHCNGIDFFNISNNCNLRVFIVLGGPLKVATALLKYQCVHHSITIHAKFFPGARSPSSSSISISAFFSHYCFSGCAFGNSPAINKGTEARGTNPGVILSPHKPFCCCYPDGFLLQIIIFYLIVLLTTQTCDNVIKYYKNKTKRRQFFGLWQQWAVGNRRLGEKPPRVQWLLLLLQVLQLR